MITLILAFTPMILLGFIGWYFERKRYNRGVCNCGENLKYFDTDSQGGRGYTCKKCNYTTWVSWWE